MKKEIVVDVSFNQTRLALLEDEQLMEVYIENNTDQNVVGNIYRGKVKSILPGIQAAFIDIGLDKNAFLYAGELKPNISLLKENKKMKIEQILSPGQEITVQVIKDSFGTKGTRVTTNISLPGRYMVLLPNIDYIGVSKRIKDDKERKRLKSIAKKLKIDGMGIIIRTEAQNKLLEDIEEDINFLQQNWDVINKKNRKGQVPRCIYKELCLIYKSVRDMLTNEIDKFIINDKETYEKAIEDAKIFSNSLEYKIKHYSKPYDIFEYYHIESQIREAVARKVWLKNGGYLVIDKTEALTVIDVNTGKYIGRDSLEETILKTNLEAARAIARQIRLRDIGGIIIIDFIDMKTLEDKQKILEELKESIKKDKTKISIIGMTGLGLVEMTRKKVRQSLLTTLTIECCECNGTGRVAKIESTVNKIEKALINTNLTSSKITLEINPKVNEYLRSNNNLLQKIEHKINCCITIKPNKAFKQNQYSIKS